MEKESRRILDLGVVGLELRVTGIMPKSNLLGKSPKLMFTFFSQPLIGEEAQDLGVGQSGTEFPKLAVVVHSFGVENFCSSWRSHSGCWMPVKEARDGLRFH